MGNSPQLPPETHILTAVRYDPERGGKRVSTLRHARPARAKEKPAAFPSY